MKVVITGGGTGGHIYPALSIARELRDTGAELLFIGSRHGPEGALAGKEGIPFHAVPSGPIAGLTLRTAASLARLVLGVIKAYGILRRFRPDVLIGTGGYTSAGVVFAGWLRGIPVIIHEQNSIPGRTNRLLARLARKVCVTFEESAAYFPEGKTVVTGLPVRPDIIAGMDRRAARESLGLDPDTFTVLVLGGSQGARRINELTLEGVGDAECGMRNAECGIPHSAFPIQVLHQTGQRNYEEVMSRRPDAPDYHVRPYIDDMAAAYSAADLVVARSGASTIAEITVRGLPAILIPYPYAHAGHQTKNAESLARAGAAVVLDEAGLTGPALSQGIMDLASDEPRLQAMAEASRKLGRPDAAAEIVTVIYSIFPTGAA